MPAKTRLATGLSAPIYTATAAAGDRVEGVLLRDARSNTVVARANDRVQGRILRLVQLLDVPPRWYIAIRFDSMERDGIEQPISLKPLDDGVRNALPVRRKIAIRIDKPDGAGLFVFSGAGDLVLDRSFHSEWETR